jgi:hypothetical protein
MEPELSIPMVFDDLDLVAGIAPNERLPKEEQSRCSLYAFLRQRWRVVCVERAYTSIDEGSSRECDLLAISHGRPWLWVELKHCRCASGYYNKPSEELGRWESDIDKLRRVPVDSERYFVLFCFSDFDTSGVDLPRRGNVVRAIRSFHAAQQVFHRCRAFTWRENDGITHVGAWVWRWEINVPIGGRETAAE